MNDESESHNYDETDDKYAQFPKRAVESEYKSTQQEEEEPAIMSRQAKYNKKSKKAKRDEQFQEDYYQNEDDSYGYEDGYAYNQEPQEPQVDPRELKAQRKKEKAEIRAKKREKKKAYNKRMKERRKNQPSAVNQRRMNYEERRQMFQGEKPQEDNQENQVEHKDDTENK